MDRIPTQFPSKWSALSLFVIPISRSSPPIDPYTNMCQLLAQPYSLKDFCHMCQCLLYVHPRLEQSHLRDTETLYLVQYSNLARIERSAEKQAKSGAENAGWYEKWWELDYTFPWFLLKGLCKDILIHKCSLPGGRNMMPKVGQKKVLTNMEG